MSTDSPAVYVTSHAQERLWIVDQLEGRGTSYNGTTTLSLEGDLDVEALRGAVAAAVNRHGALRTGFSTLKGVPVQVVRPTVSVPVEYDDLRELGADEAAAQMWRLFGEDSAVAFDLAVPPLLRARLVRLAQRRHALNLCIHHIVYDEWSAGLFLGDIATFYESAVTGKAPDPPASRRGYGDYATLQRRRLRGARRSVLERFWRDRLAGAPEVIALPADRPRPAVQSFRGAWTMDTMSDAAAGDLRALARAEGATTFMVLLAGFAAVLGRYSGERDIVIGTSVADRGDSDFDDVVGFFVNTLVLRTDLSGQPTFRNLVRRTRDMCLAAYAHQDLPFERVVDLVQPRRTTAHQPVFQVMLTLQTTSADPPSFGDVQVSALRPAATGWTQFDLSLSAVEHAAGLELRVQYSTDLFDHDTATRLARHVRTLLTAAGEDPDRPVAALPLVAGGERATLLALGRGVPAPVADTAAGCVPARIEEQAARTPDTVAVSSGTERLTYRELDIRANQLARALGAAGAGPETTIGIAASRGVDFVVAVQAVWRAGAAFVPVDPAHPADRIGHVLDQSACRLVLTDTAGRAVLNSRVPAVDIAPAAHQHLSGDPLERRYRPAGLAYIIFTSGTTGVPKGVMVTHDGLANHVLAKIGDLGMGPGDVLAQNGPATFDVVVWQCCAPMLLGGRVHVVPDDVLTDPECLAADLADGGVTVLQAVPSTIALLLASAAATRMLTGLRWLVPTGDALPAELVHRWFTAHPGIPMLNTYGVTECSDDQCHAVIAAPPAPSAGAIATIGTPVDNMRAYVLTGDLEMAPAGVPGDLHLGGVGVGRGYVGRPGLTSDRFVPDPFGEPGTRCYRTGDVVRWRPDGTLEFLGRSDHQVKIRGFRIEPAEIEAALATHPAVRTAVVGTSGAAGPDRRLVAYVVAEHNHVPAADLRRFAAGRLPGYMVPDHVVWLDELPVTAHGKLDRAALPAPGSGTDAVSVPRGEPDPMGGAPVESVIAGIWQQVLGRERIDAHEDFFDAGGNSLLAISLLNHVRAACDVRLSLADLLESPTLAGIAGTVRAALREGLATEPLSPIPRADRSTTVPASFAQERMWVIDQLAESPALYAVPLAVKLFVLISDEDLRAAVGRLLARHEVLRTGVEVRDGLPVQVIADSVPDPLVIVDLSTVPDEPREHRVRELLTEDARRGVPLGAPPLATIRAVRLAPGELVLSLVLHHAVTDAWSNDVLVRDLVELVLAASADRPAELPDLPVQYADYAVWQRAGLTGERQDALVTHWTSRLAGAPELSTFPPTRPRPARQSYRGGKHEFVIPPDVVAAVRRFAKAEQATPFMVLVTALGVLLGNWADQDDLVIGVPVSGREHPQVRDVVGLFVNTVPLRLDLSGRPDFLAALRRARQVCLDAYTHADLPFETLIQRVQPRRSLAHHPIFQVMLTMQGTPAEWHTAGDRTAVAHPAPFTATAKFDLHVYVTDQAGRWDVVVEYASDLYDPDTARRLGEQLSMLLGSAAADPRRWIGTMHQVPDRERRQIERWTTGPVALRQPETLPDLVAAQVAASPDAPALRWDGRSLTYREFHAEVAGLAGRLRELGVGVESVVGVCLPRGASMVIALHAVVAAGAAYLPLSLDHPAERLRLLVQDAGAEVVIGPAALLTGIATRIVDVTERGRPAGTPRIPADALAYVIHTSGSTGRPKGVQVSHRSVVNRLRWLQRVLPIGAGDRVLHKTPFGFDVSVWELFWPLSSGAELVVAPPDTQRDPRLLWEILDQEGVGLVHFVPSMLGPFLDVVAEAGRPPGALRTVACSGEQLSPRLVERCRLQLPAVDLHNFYGPTEAAIEVTWHRCEPSAVVPIGRPMDNVRVEILGPAGDRVPIGAKGGLYLGGVQVARGYAGSPGLTADRFVPDPSGPPGSRMYRTGDVARWLPDGAVEYLGRSDFQVKLRGLRIEPAEIEAALAAHPAVTEAVVTVVEGRLVAYLVTAGTPAESELRGHLAARLPDYLVPARFVPLAALPVNAAGKFDRAALPVPDTWRSDQAPAYAAPASRTEEVLCGLWSAVLDVETVGVHDNFFQLGGDSIMSLLVVSRAAKAGIRISPRQFFDQQTVAELAAVAVEDVEDGTSPRPDPAASAGGAVDEATMDQVLAMLRAHDQLAAE
ncbi:amino acid adenylation domain-containing protein [Actinophytocola sp.]|uniref:amino acid adenylation domain-containing protein n=1 Tax=Actinophytocola sp. TaxID=1872138 RepID=UPI00389AF4C6